MISEARAPFTRPLLMFSFLQELLDIGCTPSTLKVYTTAITPIAGQSFRKYDLVVKYLTRTITLYSGCKSSTLQVL